MGYQYKDGKYTFDGKNDKFDETLKAMGVSRQAYEKYKNKNTFDDVFVDDYIKVGANKKTEFDDVMDADYIKEVTVKSYASFDDLFE